MLDLPQPFGPTTALMLWGNCTVVGSTKDLNPASLIDFNRILFLRRGSPHPLLCPYMIKAESVPALRLRDYGLGHPHQPFGANITETTSSEETGTASKFSDLKGASALDALPVSDKCALIDTSERADSF